VCVVSFFSIVFAFWFVVFVLLGLGLCGGGCPLCVCGSCRFSGVCFLLGVSGCAGFCCVVRFFFFFVVGACVFVHYLMKYDCVSGIQVLVYDCGFGFSCGCFWPALRWIVVVFCWLVCLRVDSHLRWVCVYGSMFCCCVCLV